MNGIDLIAAERRRQVEVEGWTPDHDDEHDDGAMAYAAACYAAPEPIFVYREAENSFFVNSGDRGDRQLQPAGHYSAWPWDDAWDKRAKHGQFRRLIIAGALITAEIDRVIRLRDRADAPKEPRG